MITTIPAGTIEVRGAFDLAASARFLEGFTPAARPDAAEEPGTLRMAFPADGSWAHVGVVVKQRAPGEVSVDSNDSAVVEQVRRILSLDIDGAGFDNVGRGDPVVAHLQKRYPGLRPVLFSSPYEAACWTIIGNRIRMTQAARIKQRLAEEYGQAVDVGGRDLVAFPAPEVLATIDRPPGLSELKIERLRAIARAAQEGQLDARMLRSLGPEEAMAQLRQVPGIGPFSAELILVRGAGHPDVFPRNEERLHDEMRFAYALPAADASALAVVAERWSPFRSWVALLMRTYRMSRGAN
ncbi:MAG TPA: DNA-3-methyladenine glycosylase 2 family protein [Amycolatopsis sp.]|nr:DNA-3-methyladenine glycosylase 2 family protein [Amycolatopsis sp.]